MMIHRTPGWASCIALVASTAAWGCAEDGASAAHAGATGSGGTIDPSGAGAGPSACDPPCQLAHAVAACELGGCVVAQCDAGFGDCDGLAKNGCERAVDDLDHCGGCHVVCPEAQGANRTCSGGACGFACHQGSADCDGDAASGCEVDLLADAAHCGACGHDCAGAGCGDGMCEAVVLVDNGPTQDPFGHLAHALTIDEEFVYYSAYDASVRRVSKAGGDDVVLIAASEGRHAWDLAVDASHLFVLDAVKEEVVRMPKDGSSAAVAIGTLTPYLANPGHLTLDDQHVYWTQVLPLPRCIKRADKLSGGEVVWHDSPMDPPHGVTAHGGWIYWTQGSTVWRASSADAVAVPELVASDTRNDMAVHADPSGVYWAARPTEPPEQWLGGIASVGASSTSMDLLAQDNAVVWLTADADRIYWASATGEGRVLRVDKSGGVPTPLLLGVEPLSSNTPSLRLIAVDETSVYYNEARKGLVLKVAK